MHKHSIQIDDCGGEISFFILDDSKKILPAHLLLASEAAIKTATSAITPQKVQYAINHPFQNVADAASYFYPEFSPIFHKYAGFNIPLHSQEFTSLLKNALNDGKLDKLTIITALGASIEIPPAGLLKQVALYVVKEFLCKIVQSGLLPGLENNVAFSKNFFYWNNSFKPI